MLDEFSLHEALDRTWILCEIVDTTLHGHTVILGNPKFHQKVDAVLTILSELYQEIGLERFKAGVTNGEDSHKEENTNGNCGQS